MIKLIFMISHKYLNHGGSVPIQKCFESLVKYNNKYTCSYSTMSSSNNNSVKLYEVAYSMKKSIIKDNKKKSGIYKWTNRLTNDIYIGQSVDLSKRFIRYFNLSYLKNKGTEHWNVWHRVQGKGDVYVLTGTMANWAEMDKKDPAGV